MTSRWQVFWTINVSVTRFSFNFQPYTFFFLKLVFLSDIKLLKKYQTNLLDDQWSSQVSTSLVKIHVVFMISWPWHTWQSPVQAVAEAPLLQRTEKAMALWVPSFDVQPETRPGPDPVGRMFRQNLLIISIKMHVTIMIVNSIVFIRNVGVFIRNVGVTI